MALQQLFEARTGDAYPNAYFRVNGISFDYVDRVVTIHLAVYRDEAAALSDPPKEPVSVRNIVMTAEQFAATFGGTADPRRRLYPYLKTLPDFSNAVDAAT